jgi:hypothetical protein
LICSLAGPNIDSVVFRSWRIVLGGEVRAVFVSDAFGLKDLPGVIVVERGEQHVERAERRPFEFVSDFLGIAGNTTSELVDLRSELVVVAVGDGLAQFLRALFARVDDRPQERRRVGGTGPTDQLLGVLAEIHRIAHAFALFAERAVLLADHELADRYHERRARNDRADQRRDDRLHRIAGFERRLERREGRRPDDREHDEHENTQQPGDEQAVRAEYRPELASALVGPCAHRIGRTDVGGRVAVDDGLGVDALTNADHPMAHRGLPSRSPTWVGPRSSRWSISRC